MKRISVELVPRDEDALRQELALLGKFQDKVDVINIPDLLRFPIRSWQGAAVAKEYFPASMPHIRAMDIDLDKELAMKDYLRAHDIREVLVIEGDPPQDMMHEVYPTNSVDVIWKFRKEMPEVKVYADMLQGLEVYWGISPVMSARSQSYWERKNHVVFPHAFEPTLDWSIGFAKEVMDFAEREDANVYLMPIKTNLEAYLAGVLA